MKETTKKARKLALSAETLRARRRRHRHGVGRDSAPDRPIAPTPTTDRRSGSPSAWARPAPAG